MKFLLNEILKPATHRIGSALGVYFASLGAFDQVELDTLESASIIALGFVADLIVRKAL